LVDSERYIANNAEEIVLLFFLVLAIVCLQTMSMHNIPVQIANQR